MRNTETIIPWAPITLDFSSTAKMASDTGHGNDLGERENVMAAPASYKFGYVEVFLVSLYLQMKKEKNKSRIQIVITKSLDKIHFIVINILLWTCQYITVYLIFDIASSLVIATATWLLIYSLCAK